MIAIIKGNPGWLITLNQKRIKRGLVRAIFVYYLFYTLQHDMVSCSKWTIYPFHILWLEMMD